MDTKKIEKLLSTPIIGDIKLGVTYLSMSLENEIEKEGATELVNLIFDNLRKDLTHPDYNAPQKKDALERIMVFCDKEYACPLLISETKKLINNTSIVPATVKMWDEYEKLK